MVRPAFYTLIALLSAPALGAGELLSPPPGASCAAQFRRITEKFAGREIPVIQVSGLEKRSSTAFGQEVAIEDVLGTKNTVAIGLNNGHFYLYANGARHHGKLPVGEGLRDIRKNTNFVKDGVLVTFPDLSPAEVAALRDSLVAKADQGKRTLSCATSGYRELKAGTDLRLRGCSSVLPSTIVKKVLRGDLVRTNGQPVKIEIYRTNDLRFKDIHDQFSNMQSTILIVSAMPVGFVGMVAWAYKAQSAQEEKLRKARKRDGRRE